MILKSLPLLSLLLLISCAGTSVDKSPENVAESITKETTKDIQSSGNGIVEPIINNLVDVYIAKGNTQCNNDGLSLAESISNLSASDINITASHCGIIEGVSFASVCGGGTADIYIHTINTTDLIKASTLGFTDTSLLTVEHLTYSVVNCPTSQKFTHKDSK